MRAVILCLMFASVSLFGKSGFELWVEGLQTGNRLTPLWSGKSDHLETQLMYVRALWTVSQDSKLAVSCGVNLADGHEEITSGPILGQGVTYAQTMCVYYEPRFFVGLNYRTPGKTTFSFGADIRNSYISTAGMGYSVDSFYIWELVPSVQFSWNVHKRIAVRVKVGYRLQLDNNVGAEWFDKKQNHPKFGIVAGWKFGIP